MKSASRHSSRSAIRRTSAAALLLAALLGLNACAGAVVGAGAAAGTAGLQERGIDIAIVDSRIQAEINHGWLELDKELFVHLASAVYEGRVLLTGVVKSEDLRAEVIRRAWSVRGVREVINEIAVDSKGSSGTFARDTWISAQLRAKILVDRDILGVNYAVETVRQTVYLFGVAQDKKELDKVINYARNIEFVERVVNHVLLKNDPRRKS
ncbi:MAG: hypothetical protein RL477_2125 [Pseudomonadota bacterium]|jgi:osmotically-inducible protein OsmY